MTFLTSIAIVRRCVVLVLLALATLYAASVAVQLVGRDHYLNVVRKAVQTGVLGQTIVLPLAHGEPSSVYNFNDCLILSMLVLPPQDKLLTSALSPLVPAVSAPWDEDAIPGYPHYVQCRDLASVLNAAPGQEPRAVYYHRYLHGDWVLAGLLLALLPFGLATNLLGFVLIGTLVALVAMASRNVFRGEGANASTRDRAYAVLGLTLLLFYDLPVYCRSLSFAPADIVIAGFLLYSYLYRPSLLSNQAFATAASLFGALTLFFEFLTGGIPSGIMAIMAVVAFDDWPDRATMVRRLLVGIGSFTGAIALCFLVKMGVVTAIWGSQELSIFVTALSAHAGSSAWSIAPENLVKLRHFGVDVNTIRSSRLLSYLYALSKIMFFARGLTFGSIGLSLALIGALPIALATRRIVCLATEVDEVRRTRDLLLLGACAVMPVWYFVMVQHTIIHAFFMFRPMVWPLGLLLAVESGCWRSRLRAKGNR